MITLTNLIKTCQKKKKRIGRGVGSGKGKNAGYGNKGQSKRSGVPIGFIGNNSADSGRSALATLPKYKGFKARDKKDTAVLTLLDLNKFQKDTTVSIENLKKAGIIKSKIKKVRIIGTGKFDFKFKVEESSQIHLTKSTKELLK